MNTPNRMTAATTYSAFHQWLLASPANAGAPCALILHVDPPATTTTLIEEIANYLNEYDDDGDGCWLPATHELVGKIARDDNYRQLLGIHGTPEENNLETLSALGQRGRVIFFSPESGGEHLEPIRAFHAGVGSPAGDGEDCHLIVNPELLDRSSIPHIIGDVFLEWMHSGHRRPPSIHEME